MKLLESDQISVIYLKNILPDNVNAKLEELSANTSLTLKSLAVSVVANSEHPIRIFRRSADFHLKVIIYGLNSKNDPITHDEIKA